MKSEIMSWIKTIVIAFAITGVTRFFLFEGVAVHGESMAPTFENEDKLIVTKTTHIDRFDQIVFHAPDSDDNYIKRVIGVPGDTVEMMNDTLYINGKAVKEPYLLENKQNLLPGQKLTGDFTLPELTGKEKVPEGYFFVMGDNRLVSKDSRAFGFIRSDSVIGEAQLRFYPLSHMQTY